MTRGRETNIAYVPLDKPDDSHVAPQPDEVTAQTVLFGVLRHSEVELSAHQTIEAEQCRWSSIAQFAAEYETVAVVAQRERWAALVRACGLSNEQAEEMIESASFGPLTAELRRAEAKHHHVAAVLPRLVASRPLVDAADTGAVLISRLEHATSQPAGGKSRRVPTLIVGLVPVAEGPMSDEMRSGLAEREALMEARAVALVEDAACKSAPWLPRLGQPPTLPKARDRWIREARTVAAYRDRCGIDDKGALGPEPTTDTQRLDRARANAAIRRAEAIARDAEDAGGRRRTPEATAVASASKALQLVPFAGDPLGSCACTKHWVANPPIAWTGTPEVLVAIKCWVRCC